MDMTLSSATHADRRRLQINLGFLSVHAGRPAANQRPCWFGPLLATPSLPVIGLGSVEVQRLRRTGGRRDLLRYVIRNS